MGHDQLHAKQFFRKTLYIEHNSHIKNNSTNRHSDTINNFDIQKQNIKQKKNHIYLILHYAINLCVCVCCMCVCCDGSF